jgi:hypothetical protein
MNYIAKDDSTHGTIFTVVDWQQISASEDCQVMTFEGQIMTHAGQIVTPRGSYYDPYQDITKKEPRTSDAREAEFENGGQSIRGMDARKKRGLPGFD